LALFHGQGFGLHPAHFGFWVGAQEKPWAKPQKRFCPTIGFPQLEYQMHSSATINHQY